MPYAHPVEKNRRSYTPHAEGKPPTIVMEFLSDTEGKEYNNSPIHPYGKWYFYETILQVPWYIVFDSNDGELEVYHLENDCYKTQTADKNGRFWIDSLELFLGTWKGLNEDFQRNTCWLRWWDVTGKRLPWQYENTKFVENEKQKALQEKQKALQEKQEALQEKQEALEKAKKAETEKRKALEEVKQATNNTTRLIAKQMLQAQAQVAFIQQVTGLDKAEILLLNN